MLDFSCKTIGSAYTWELMLVLMSLLSKVLLGVYLHARWAYMQVFTIHLEFKKYLCLCQWIIWSYLWRQQHEWVRQRGAYLLAHVNSWWGVMESTLPSRGQPRGPGIPGSFSWPYKRMYHMINPAATAYSMMLNLKRTEIYIYTCV